MQAIPDLCADPTIHLETDVSEGPSGALESLSCVFGWVLPPAYLFLSNSSQGFKKEEVEEEGKGGVHLSQVKSEFPSRPNSADRLGSRREGQPRGTGLEL